MTWAKFSDSTDEELEYLGHAAHRLFVDAVTMSRRRHLGGNLAPTQLGPMMRRLHIPRAAIAELVANGPEGEPLWVQNGDTFHIRNYEKYNPLSSTERVKKHRAEKRNETLQAVSSNTDVTALARASATGLETISTSSGFPTPVPTPVPEPFIAPPTPQVRELDAITKADPATELLLWWHGFIGRQISEDDRIAAPGLLEECPRLGVTGIKARIVEHAEWRIGEEKEPIRTLQGYRYTLAKQEIYLADNGVLKPRTVAS